MRIRTIAVVFVLILSCSLWAQDTRGMISGRVLDPTGAAVPGAVVVVSNPAMATRATLTTTADGIYRAPFLSPGLYDIEVSAAGFKKALARAG